MNINLENLGYDLIPGPPGSVQPLSSICVKEIVSYPVELVSHALLKIEGTSLVVNSGGWWEWQAILKSEKGCINFQMTCFGDKDEYWGGFEMSGLCDPSLLLMVWSSLVQNGIHSIYLHSNDCSMLTLDSFKLQYKLC